MPSWKKVILSGSNAALNSLNVTTTFTASGLNYPTTDNGEESFLQTNGSGNLSFQYVKTIYEEIYNGEATTITKGTPVYVSGSVGAAARVFRADASNASKMPVIYISADNIASGATGRGIALGLITGVDTTGYPAGSEIYVAAGGGWTSTRPTGTNIVQLLGIVTKEGAGGQGIVLNPGPFENPNLTPGNVWVGNGNSLPVPVATSSLSVASASFAVSSSSAVSSSYTEAAKTVGITTQDITPITYNVVFTGGSSGNQSLNVDTTALTYNPSTSTLTVPNLAGTASFAVSSSRAVSSSFATLAANATNATNATNSINVGITNNTSTAADYFLTFVGSQSGNQALNVDDARLSYRPSTNTLTVDNLTGNASTATSASYATVAGSTSAVAGTTNYVSKFTSGTTIGNSLIYDNGTNVGIGTTSPNSKLEVLGKTTINSSVSGDVITNIVNTSSNGYGTRFQGGGGNSGLYLVAFNDYAGNAKMLIDGNGNVGIGTTSPNFKLGIQASEPTFGILQAISNNNGGNATLGAKILFDVSGIGNFWEGMPSGANAWAVGLYNGSTNPEYMRITSGGNVGIGTSSPSERLEVQNGTSGAKIKVSNTGGGYASLECSSNASSVAQLSFTNQLSLIGGDVSIGTTTSLLPNTGRGNLTINGTSQAILTLGVGGAWNSYFYTDGSNTQIGAGGSLILGTNGGGEKMRITSAGNVGIGTSSPLRLLHVAGLSYFGSDIFTVNNGGIFFSGDGSYQRGIYSNASGLTLQTLGSPKLTIDDSGNTGIGTTSPSQKLDVYGVAVFGTNTGRYTTIGGSSGTMYTQGEVGGWAFGHHAKGSSGTDRGGFGWLGSSDAISYYYIGGAYNNATMYVTSGSSGAVGISTQSPTAKLNVIGDIHLGSYSNLSTVNLENRTGKGTFTISTDGVTNAAGTTITYSWADGGHGPLKFNNSSNEVMRLDANGNLGIGTTAPTAKLHVADTNKTFDGYGNVNVFTTNTAAADIGGSITLGGTNTTTGTTPYVFGKIQGIKEGSASSWNGALLFGTTAGSSAVTERMRITSAGRVGIGTTSPSYPLHVAIDVSGTSIYASADIVAYSDESVKENIRPIENVIERIQQSRGVIYDRTDIESKDNIGFIAQELEIAFPELVVTNEDGTKAVKYQNTVAVLFEAIKEQQKQIDELKQIVNGFTK